MTRACQRASTGLRDVALRSRDWSARLGSTPAGPSARGSWDGPDLLLLKVGDDADWRSWARERAQGTVGRIALPTLQDFLA